MVAIIIVGVAIPDLLCDWLTMVVFRLNGWSDFICQSWQHTTLQAQQDYDHGRFHRVTIQGLEILWKCVARADVKLHESTQLHNAEYPESSLALSTKRCAMPPCRGKVRKKQTDFKKCYTCTSSTMTGVKSHLGLAENPSADYSPLRGSTPYMWSCCAPGPRCCNAKIKHKRLKQNRSVRWARYRNSVHLERNVLL